MKSLRRRIAILGHVRRPGVRRAAARLRQRLARRGCTVGIEQALADEMGLPGQDLASLTRECHLLVALGGDGTALTGARALAGRRGTLLPVNHGGLGFLTVAESRDLDAAVDAALAGAWPVVRRRLLKASVTRRGRTLQRGLAMNDAVIKGAGGYAALHLRMGALGHDLGHLVADGLIAATAAGSTAYSLSAGGPVLDPDVEALVVTPVCAHSLGSRPLVLAPGAEITVRLLGSFDQALLLLDGQEQFALERNDRISIRLGRTTTRIFTNPALPFTRKLQAKLGWQGSSRRSL